MYIKEVTGIREEIDLAREVIIEIQVNTDEGPETLELTLNGYMDLMMHLQEFTSEHSDYLPENLPCLPF